MNEIITWRPVFWVTKPKDLKVSVRLTVEQGHAKLAEILKGSAAGMDMGGLNSPSAWHEFVKAVMAGATMSGHWDKNRRIVIKANYRSMDGETLEYGSLVVAPRPFDVTPFVGKAGGMRDIPYTYETTDDWIIIYPDLPQRDPSDINI